MDNYQYCHYNCVLVSSSASSVIVVDLGGLDITSSSKEFVVRLYLKYLVYIYSICLIFIVFSSLCIILFSLNLQYLVCIYSIWFVFIVFGMLFVI